MQVTLKYYEGLGKEEKKFFDIPEQELEQMVEKDYQLRLADASSDEIILKRTPQEIFDEMNKQERNLWEGHHRHLAYLQTDDDEGSEMNVMDAIADHSQEEEHERQEGYDELCQKIRQVLKPEQADMVIAIYIDGMSIEDYAIKIGDKPNNITYRLIRVKKRLKEILAKTNN